MAYLETMTAFDKDQRSYSVIVNGVVLKTVAGSRTVRDYSLEDTGEVLEIVDDEPLVLRILSSGTLLVDSRDVT